MRHLKHVAGILLAAGGMDFVLGFLFLYFDPEEEPLAWKEAALILSIGLLLLGGAYALLWPALSQPAKSCPQCGSTERETAYVLRKSQDAWLHHFWGWMLASLWGASRGCAED